MQKEQMALNNSTDVIFVIHAAVDLLRKICGLAVA